MRFGVVIHEFRVDPGQAAELGVKQKGSEAADAERQSQKVVTKGNAAAISVAVEDPGLIAGNAFLEKNPRAKELLMRSKRAGMAKYYFPLYVKLWLDDAQSTRLEEILAANGGVDSFPTPDGTDV